VGGYPWRECSAPLPPLVRVLAETPSLRDQYFFFVSYCFLTLLCILDGARPPYSAEEGSWKVLLERAEWWTDRPGGGSLLISSLSPSAPSEPAPPVWFAFAPSVFRFSRGVKSCRVFCSCSLAICVFGSVLRQAEAVLKEHRNVCTSGLVPAEPCDRSLSLLSVGPWEFRVRVLYARSGSVVATCKRILCCNTGNFFVSLWFSLCFW